MNSSFGPGKRISYNDKQKIQEHIDSINDLQNKLNSNASCADIVTPSNNYNLNSIRYNYTRELDEAAWKDHLDMLVLAFKCGLSRISTIAIGESSTYTGNFHQEIAHNNTGEAGQAELVTCGRFTADKIFGYLAKQMEATVLDEESGTTMLDQALIAWTQEFGQRSHTTIGLPTITAGSAGGYLNTGLYLDYRNLTNTCVNPYNANSSIGIPGLTYNRFLTTVLNSMGIPQNEWARPGIVGYGDPVTAFAGVAGGAAHPARVVNDADQDLPRLKS